MNNFKKTVVLIIIGFIFTSCIAAIGNAVERKFSRYKGRALKFDIPLYQGLPPGKYSYENLGYVKGEHKGTYSDSAASTIAKALENLANKAKEMEANAVINVESHNKGIIFSYDGEAVIFDKLPDE